MKPRSLILMFVLLCGCATRHADHFYVLGPQPRAVRESIPAFDRQVALRLSIPSVVDRTEMVLSIDGGVEVLEHERWAAPLADLMTSALARDIEERRNDVLVLPHRADKTGLSRIEIAIDVDEVTARLGDRVSIEAHWRISDVAGGKTSLGRDVFAAPMQSHDYAAVANALSASIALLADRLVKEIP